jgi:hypothetical protein
MEFNKLIYPAPEPFGDINFFLQSDDDEMKNMLLLIDYTNEKGKVEYQIPCIFLDNRHSIA